MKPTKWDEAYKAIRRSTGITDLAPSGHALYDWGDVLLVVASVLALIVWFIK